MLSNTAVPRYYGTFRDAVIQGDIPVCKEVAMEMYRIDRLIESPSYYYDDLAVEGWIEFCEGELTLTDGSDLHLLDSFKLWGGTGIWMVLLCRSFGLCPQSRWPWWSLCDQTD